MLDNNEPLENQQIDPRLVAAASDTRSLVERIRANIPQPMQDAKQWLLHGATHDTRPKIPYYTNGNPRSVTGTAEDIEQLDTLDNVIRVFNASEFKGIGFAILNGFHGIDIDHAEQHPDLANAALEIDCYKEVSLNGGGFHLYGYGERFKAFTKPKLGVEAYSAGRYFTVTGQMIDSSQALPDLANTAQSLLDIATNTAPAPALFNVTDEMIATIRGQSPADDLGELSVIDMAMFKTAPAVTTASASPSAEIDEFITKSAPIRTELLTDEQVADVTTVMNDPRYIEAGGHYDTWFPTILPFRQYGEQGRIIAKDWSSKCDNYEGEIEFNRKWDQLPSDPKIIGIGSIFAIAARLGIPNPAKGRRVELPADDEQEWLARENAQYFVTILGDRTIVVRESSNSERSPALLSPRSYQDARCNEFVNVTTANGKVKSTPISVAWFNHPQRRQYLEGMGLYPRNDAPEGVYNLWRGLAVTPRAGDCSLALEHIFNVICAGDINAYDFLIKWLARSIQSPELRGETAVVLRGGEGTGKGTLGHWMLKIVGRHHGFHLTNPQHLVGKFNAHLEHCVFCFADEALYAGDKAGNEVLKGLITEPTITIEQKFVSAYSAPNHLSILMASNSDWVIPAGTNARRYLVLDVPNSKQGDTDYFSALHANMNGDGLGALAYFLLHLDLSGFDHRNPPKTAALASQKILSFSPINKWIYDGLYRGALGTFSREWEGSKGITRDALVKDFGDWVRDRNMRHVNISADAIGKALRATIGATDKRESSGSRQRLWIFPDLATARQLFEYNLLTGEAIQWDDNDDAD